MKIVEKKKLEKSVDFEVELENSEFNSFKEEALTKVIRKTKQKVKIPGFRQGKAPDSEVKKYVNEIEVYDVTINAIANKLVAFVESSEEFEKDDSETIETPNFDVVSLKENEYKFKLSYALYPVVTVEKYDDIVLPKIELKSLDEEVKNEIDHALKTKTKKVVKDENGVIEEGDSVLFDFKGLMNGKEFEGGTSTDYRLVIGSKQFIPGFEDQMIGLKVGEEKTLKLKFPEDYHAELAGKDVDFEVKIKEISAMKLPEFDNEFVESLNVKDVKTPSELKEYLSNEIKKAKEENFKNESWTLITNKLLERSTITEIPEVMLERETNVLKQQIMARISQYNITLKQYLEFTKEDENQFNENLKKQAHNTIKLSLLIDEIAKQNKLEVSEEEAKENIDEVAAYYSGDLKANKEYLSNNIDTVKEMLLHKKVVDFLISLNKKNEQPKEESKSKK